MSKASSRPVREMEFEKFLARLLERQATGTLIEEPHIGNGYRPDFLILPEPATNERPAIIEARIEAPLTRTRLDTLISRMKVYENQFILTYPGRGRPSLSLATLSPLSLDLKTYLENQGIDCIDKEKLVFRAISSGLQDELADLLLRLTGRDTTEPEPDIAKTLMGGLDDLEGGKKDWSAYQDLCTEALGFLFCPPLGRPLAEHATESKINRRDIILPNYSMEGFFYFLRTTYKADYIVADAKNYKGLVGKSQTLQLANYLSPHGVGLFGLILTRFGANKSALYIQREQWLYHQKLIIFLTDGDLRNMVSLRSDGTDPTSVLQQKIEDFRLSI